ncbi:MAG TPA: nucleotidyl transferase AbiEii/AbiGii toxin family protein [Acidimicrobiales bacterium]|nr:nucleotidyl transferase AbiEii/AbiGii toxin family protein [Acidimicrobiales bacterium]
MITNREIANAANEWQLRHDVVEKDYVLGWLLAGIANHRHTQRWAFKGGTCLRKCWFETYRFSEDLDFTVGPEDLDPDALTSRFAEIGAWLHEQCGLEIRLDERSFRPRVNKRGNPTIEGRIGYVGPLASPSMPKVKLDLTADEVVVRPLERRPVFHPFTDLDATARGADHIAAVLSYSLPELMGEKLRALAERCRPRDLYDVIHTHRHPDLIGRAHDVVGVLERKCAHVGIEPPTLDSIRATTFRAEIEGEWSSMLGHQLPYLPPFEEFWAELDELFAWLGGGVAVPALQPMPVGSDVTEWRPARYMTTWNSGAPLELIRFAGANRLKIAVDYRPERGRVGTRVVEPYSLRRSREGHLLLYVLNDRRQIRSYRVDRIRGVSIQPETFAPRFRIEF